MIAQICRGWTRSWDADDLAAQLRQTVLAERQGAPATGCASDQFHAVETASTIARLIPTSGALSGPGRWCSGRVPWPGLLVERGELRGHCSQSCWPAVRAACSSSRSAVTTA